MLYTAFVHEGPAAIRYPRGTGPGAAIQQEMSTLEIGSGVTLRQGSRVAILNFGTLLPAARQAAENLGATLVDMRWVKPMDEQLVLELAANHALLVSVEENAIAGGAGAGVSEVLSRVSVETPVLHLGIPDHFVEHGDHGEQLAVLGLDGDGIGNSIRSRLAEKDAPDGPARIEATH
jgi:1-deoxy-D-xylulose-5-phosphate synthase